MSEGAEYLEWRRAGGDVRRFRLEQGQITIGRAPTSDIWLTDPSVSRTHARLERSHGEPWSVVDTNSVNGTFVNGERVQIAAVSDGDRITIGDCRLRFRSRSEPARPDGLELAIPPTVKHAVVEAQGLFGRTLASDMLDRLDEASRRLSRAGSLTQLCGVLACEFADLLRPDRIAVGEEKGATCRWLVAVDSDHREVGVDDLPHRLVPRVEAMGPESVVAWRSVGGRRRAGANREPGAERSVLLFHVKGSNRRLGYVYVESSRPGWQAGDAEREFLSLLVRQASLTWENLDLQRETGDLNTAREVQMLLFPSTTDLHPCVDIAAQNIPARRVSGDYYDFQRMGPDRVVFILADPMGNGMSAALLMTSVQACFRLGVQAGWDLGEFDRHIHEMVLASGLEGRFVAGLLMVCDLARGELTLHAAGHHWPSIIRDGQVQTIDDREGTLPWGVPIERGAAAPALSIAGSDWSLVAYTDGVVDTTDARGEYYTRERLQQQHRHLADRPAKDVCEAILADVDAHSDKRLAVPDDKTLLVVKSCPPVNSR